MRTARARTSVEKRFPGFPFSIAYLPSFWLSGKPGLVQTDLPDLADMPYEIRKWMLEYHVLQQQKTRVKHAIEKLLESSGRGTTPET